MPADARVLAACLSAASAVAWWACHDSGRLLSLPALVLLTAGYIGMALIAAGLTFFLLHPLLAGETAICFRHLFFSAMAAASLLPGTALLIARGSAWAVIPAAAVAWLVASGIRTHMPPVPEGSAWKPASDRAYVLSPPMPGAWNGPLRAALVAALFVQLALCFATVRERTLASLAGIAGTWFLASVPGAVAYQRRSPYCLQWSGMERPWLLMLGNAFTITCFALLPHFWAPRTNGSVLPETAAAEQYREQQAPSPSTAPPDNDVHQGIIIYPEEEKHTILVPPIPSLSAGAIGEASHPLSVPFFGVYWLYRPPFRRPPPKSLVLRANPARRNLHSNDRMRLNMEARQNFGTYIDLACCSAIEVIATSNDVYTGTVAMEMTILDSAVPLKPPQSLGTIVVPTGESVTMSFAVPKTLAMPRFDEVALTFHLARIRADRAAKVGIERFVFVPRSALR